MDPKCSKCGAPARFEVNDAWDAFPACAEHVGVVIDRIKVRAGDGRYPFYIVNVVDR